MGGLVQVREVGCDLPLAVKQAPEIAEKLVCVFVVCGVSVSVSVGCVCRV